MDLEKEYADFVEARKGAITVKQRELIENLEIQLGRQSQDLDDLTPEQVGRLIFELKRELSSGNYNADAVVTLRRERPSVVTTDYEVGWQEQPRFENGKMAYLKFYRLLMMDFDSEESYQDAKGIMEGLTGACFSVYKTPRGYHVFLMSNPVCYNTEEATQLMLAMGCDPCYIMYCQKSGYKIRLSAKPNEDAPIATKFEFIEILR